MALFHKKLIQFISAMAMVCFVFYSCQKDQGEDWKPQVPPIGNMILSISNFLTDKKDGSIQLSNYQYSVISIARWNYLLQTECAIPFAAFNKAIEQKNAKIENNTWTWNYQVITDSIIINTRLSASQLNDSVYWKMYISTTKSGITGEEFLWLTGTSAQTQHQGCWIFYKDPSDPSAFMRMDWSKDDNNNSIFKLTYLKSGDSDSGSYLLQGPLDNSDYNVYFTVFDKIFNKTTLIHYNSDSKAGQIQSRLYFGDDNWHCWNSELANI